MKLKIAVVALAALGGLAFTVPASAAMPNGLPQATKIVSQSSNVEQARWVCNPWGRCWWRPNWYGAYGYWHRPWGWHRWHRWHHWRRW